MRSKTKTTLGALLAISSACGLAQAGIASAIILDDFDSDPNMGAGGPGVFETSIFDNPFNNSASFTLDTTLNTGDDVGVLNFNSDAGVGQMASITYNNNGAGLDLDAAALNAMAFELGYAFVDQEFFMSLELVSDLGGAEGTATADFLVPDGPEGVAQFLLGDFELSALFDLTDVDQVKLSFNIDEEPGGPVRSLDFVASEFRMIVPSPGAMALLGMGGLVAVRRRR